jgi:quinol monooxygenase YgiN
MFVVAVEFWLNPGRTAEFVPLIRENAKVSAEVEPGCRQFDVCLDPNDPTYVFLYEVYDDRAAFEVHLATKHFRQFDESSEAYIQRKKVRMLDQIGCGA